MKTRLNPTLTLPTDKIKHYRRGKAAIPEVREVDMPPMSNQLHAPRPLEPPMRRRVRDLRIGGRWTAFGAWVLVICWALWAAQSGWDSLPSTGAVLALSFVVAIGLFFLSRLAFGLIMEKVFKRSPRGAVLSHMVICLFLIVVGVSLLQRVDWVVDAWNAVRGLG